MPVSPSAALMQATASPFTAPPAESSHDSQTQAAAAAVNPLEPGASLSMIVGSSSVPSLSAPALPAPLIPSTSAVAASPLPATISDMAATDKQHLADARLLQQIQQSQKEARDREKTWLTRLSEQPSPQPQALTPPDEQEFGSPPMLTNRKSPTPPLDSRKPEDGPPPLGQPSRNSNAEDADMESELSEPGTNVQSPVIVGANQLEDEIVVGARANQSPKNLPVRYGSSDEDQETQDTRDVSTSSHYPKRKRTTTYSDLEDSQMETSQFLPSADEQSLLLGDRKPRRNKQSLGPKSVILGHWRDSDVPDDSRKHAVIGFIDIRDRLRTRIQPMTKDGEPLGDEYPLPPGPGGSWVTFERIVFSDHLVGLDQVHIKEYTRIRAATTSETTVEERQVAEMSAVKEAARRVRENPTLDNATAAPLIAGGIDSSESLLMPNRTEVKRRRISGGPGPSAEAFTPDSAHAQTPQPMAAHQTCFSIDPLPGTRPTRILLGYWKPSSELDVKDRHAVYGILGQNDMFRVKVVRETRDGRFIDGNFPTGAGALWISYDEVEFEDHLKPLARPQVKEYCRIRQYQLDHGETDEDRIENETKAVLEAQTRVGTLSRQSTNVTVPTLHANTNPVADPTPERPASGTSLESRSSRRLEPRPEGRLLRQSLNENELRAAQRPQQGGDSLERTSAMARREIARVEAAQGRADRHALNREHAVAAATDAAKAAAAAAAASVAPTPSASGRGLFHESDDVRRLNGIWARQESLRMRAVSEDAKIYDGVKYERKSNGPFVGKLVSQGTLINIDGEDFVEYRVLTKPSFF